MTTCQIGAVGPTSGRGVGRGEGGGRPTKCWPVGGIIVCARNAAAIHTQCHRVPAHWVSSPTSRKLAKREEQSSPPYYIQASTTHICILALFALPTLQAQRREALDTGVAAHRLPRLLPAPSSPRWSPCTRKRRRRGRHGTAPPFNHRQVCVGKQSMPSYANLQSARGAVHALL